MSAVAGWYHCSVKPVSRSSGRSAAAAYRLGESLHDRRLAETYDYTRRSGVVTAFTVAPANAPDWVHDPEALWNAAEAAETRINSQVAREYELALPSSVSAEEREAIARAFAQTLVDRYGVAATVAIHEPGRFGDDRNFHTHVLTTTRRMGADGLGEKTRVLDARKTGPQEVLYLRQHACNLINEALECAGVDERVDARSFEARGIDREATEHLGPTASEMERKGEHSERGDRNREIGEGNQHMDELVEELADLNAEIAAEEERLLDEQYGLPDDLEPDSPVPEDVHVPDPKSAFDDAVNQYAERLTEGLQAQEAAQPWTASELQDAHDSGAKMASDARTWWQRVEEYVAGYARQLSEHGQIAWRDGLTYWERAVQVLGTVRDQAADWVSGRWKSFVDLLRDERDNPRDGPDMDR